MNIIKLFNVFIFIGKVYYVLVVVVLHAGTERAEHINIIITSAQEADNVILNPVWSCGYS